MPGYVRTNFPPFSTQSSKLTRVVSTVDSAVLGARVTIGAVLGAPGVASVAVGVSANVVGPSPVGVEHNGTRLVGAVGTTGTRAGLPGQLGVVLSSAGANLLSAGGSVERKRGESKCPVHVDWLE